MSSDKGVILPGFEVTCSVRGTKYGAYDCLMRERFRSSCKR